MPGKTVSGSGECLNDDTYGGSRVAVDIGRPAVGYQIGARQRIDSAG